MCVFYENQCNKFDEDQAFIYSINNSISDIF